jgi:hypothetical protein
MRDLGWTVGSPRFPWHLGNLAIAEVRQMGSDGPSRFIRGGPSPFRSGNFAEKAKQSPPRTCFFYSLREFIGASRLYFS